jgi:hypothetical protein
MRNLSLLLICLILSTFYSCEKDKNKNEKTKVDQIIGLWTFAEKPVQNLNNYEGNLEDRTVFKGSEELTFKGNGDFIIDSINYGTWILDSIQTSILIHLTYKNGYPPDGFTLNYMVFEIINLNDSIMEVYHRYYKFDDNKYKLRKK